jgi:DNA-binding transcriptional LysR family regulator
MPSLRQIRYFLAVAELGGFTPAASTLFVAQPALSRQIALLEQEIGFALFRREPRGVRLTPAGEMFRARVSGLEKSLLEAVEESRDIDRGESGVLRLLHSSSVPAERLLPVIKTFIALAPRARIDLDRLSSEQQVTEIAEGRADIGIIRLPVLRHNPAVRFIELASERLWVALPPGHRYSTRQALSLAEIADEAFVSAVHRERGGLARRVTDLCLNRGFVPRVAQVVSRKTSMLALVAHGFGLAVLPECMTRMCSENTTCLPLSDQDAFSTTALVLPVESSPLAQRFIEIARNEWGAVVTGQ